MTAAVFNGRFPQVVITTPPAEVDDYSQYNSRDPSHGDTSTGSAGAGAASGGDDTHRAAAHHREQHAEAAGADSAHHQTADAAAAAAAARRVHISARPVPVATECHALGSLENFTFSLIEPRRPEVGVALSFDGGDSCLKRKITFAPSRGTGGAGGGAWEAGTFEADATSTTVEWVPTPRQARRIRLSCLSIFNSRFCRVT